MMAHDTAAFLELHGHWDQGPQQMQYLVPLLGAFADKCTRLLQQQGTYVLISNFTSGAWLDPPCVTVWP